MPLKRIPVRDNKVSLIPWGKYQGRGTYTGEINGKIFYYSNSTWGGMDLNITERTAVLEEIARQDLINKEKD